MIPETIATASTLLTIIKNARDLRGTASVEDNTFLEATVSTWGSILFEARENCQRVRLMVERAGQGQILFGILNFQVCDALLPEFCRIAPSPLFTVPTGRLLGRLKRVDHFQRAASTSPPVINSGATDTRYAIALGFAHDLVQKGGIEEFNSIVDVATDIARTAYNKGPNESLGYLLPEKIDPTTPVNDREL